jgi:hypothetical protein
MPTFNAISNGNVVADALRADQKEIHKSQQRAEDANFIEQVLLMRNSIRLQR